MTGTREKLDGRRIEIAAADVLQDLRQFAATHGEPASSGLYRQIGRYSHTMIARRFGGWVAACKAAGVTAAHPGFMRTCPVCGTEFRGETGPKARKCCSRACSSTLMSETHRRESASKQAVRGRAYRVVGQRDACSECAATRQGGARIEVHHLDRNIHNNTPENLQVLCVRCHKRKHRGEPRRRRARAT